ncbi:ATP-dependent Clp protease adaptor ClpS [Flavobacteriales bacterium]|nr:ATP-dependent Clp protease adaptor ClpS [Flavobacteriales bacterium]
MEFFQLSTQTEELTDVLEAVNEKRTIILFNDHVNTFDHVIDSLIALCEHEPEQAEQCAFIVHYKGKCDVKSGEYEELEPICNGLLDRGLTAEIQ